MRTERHLANAMGHRNCCVPLAFTTLTGRSYEEINAYMRAKKWRKRDNTGVHTRDIPVEMFGLKKAEDIEKAFRWKTVNHLSKYKIEGTILLRVNRHVLVLKDGVFYDTIDSKRRKIINAWRLEEPGKLPSDFDQVVASRLNPSLELMKKHVKKLAQPSAPKPSTGDKKQAILHAIDYFKQKGIKYTIKDVAIQAHASYIYTRWTIKQMNLWNEKHPKQ